MPLSPEDPPLPPELVTLVAARLSALADPTRVRLLDALRRGGEVALGDLAVEAETGYANAAKHLSLLHRERILSRRKDGSRVLYAISDPGVLAICETVCGSLAHELRELDELVGAHGLSAHSPDIRLAPTEATA